MEGQASLRQELLPEKSSANKYLLFDEKTINFFLFGSKDIRVIDVNKLKRKAENDPGIYIVWKQLHASKQ